MPVQEQACEVTQMHTCSRTHTLTHMCICMSCILYVYAYMCTHLAMCFLSSSPVIMVNTGRFQVRLTRAHVGCHLLSPLPQII